MMHLRGQAEDYDRWAALGATGWAYRDVLPYFRRLEDFEDGANEWHGAGGPIGVSGTRFKSRFGTAFIEAGLELGIPRNEDFGGATQTGVGWYQFAQRRGARAGAEAYLSAARARTNLAVRTRAEVDRLVIDAGRVVGVSGRAKGASFEFRADREIILASGALGSPRLLLLSGIGPADELRGLGITLRCDLPAVGRNLQDHPRSEVLFRVARPESLSVPALMAGFLQWVLSRRGRLTSPGIAAGAFVTLSPDSPRLDCQLVASWMGSPSERAAAGIYPCLMDVESRGAVRLASSSPDVPVVVDPNYLASPRDRSLLVEAILLIRRLARTRAMQRFGLLDEIVPGPDCTAPDDLARYLRGSVRTAFHPAGTCAMGEGAGAVVDPFLRVHGVEGLRVVDASVMPTLINGNTNAPTIMIAERAADLIRGRSGPQ